MSQTVINLLVLAVLGLSPQLLLAAKTADPAADAEAKQWIDLAMKEVDAIPVNGSGSDKALLSRISVLESLVDAQVKIGDNSGCKKMVDALEVSVAKLHAPTDDTWSSLIHAQTVAGNWPKALAGADKIKDPSERDSALVDLIEFVVERGDLQTADAARKLMKPDGMDLNNQPSIDRRAKDAKAVGLARASKWNQAKLMVSDLSNPSLPGAFAVHGNIDTAMEMVAAEPRTSQVYGCGGVIDQAVENGDLAAARKAAVASRKLIANPPSNLDWILEVTSLSPHLLPLGDDKTWIEQLNRTRPMIENLPDTDFMRPMYLVAVGESLAAFGDIDQVRKMLPEVSATKSPDALPTDVSPRDRLIEDIACWQARDGHLDDALKSIESIKGLDAQKKSDFFCDLAQNAAEGGHAADVKNWLAVLTSPIDRSQVCAGTGNGILSRRDHQAMMKGAH